MAGISIEFLLLLSYAIFLAFIALILDYAARHAHRRSLSMRTAGFTYHPERDVWRCPVRNAAFPQGVFANLAHSGVTDSGHRFLPFLGYPSARHACLHVHNVLRNHLAPFDEAAPESPGFSRYAIFFSVF